MSFQWHRQIIGLLFLVVSALGSMALVKVDKRFVGDLVRQSLTGNEYIAHEWGTFTSLQGSDGSDQIGLHRGDERLPRFVHCPRPGMSYGECLSLLGGDESSPWATTQRMETPVIYYYSKVAQTVNTRVDFPKGLFTEWYPQATSFSPALNESTGLSNGSMTWNAELKTSTLELPAVTQDNIWSAQRAVDSNHLTVSEENESFIFYRGIARFQLPFKTRTLSNGDLILENSSSDNVPSLILLDYRNQKGAFKVLSSLTAKQTLTLSAADIPNALTNGVSSGEYVSGISAALEKLLNASGLYPLESAAMVNTWKRSYFQTEGIRVLYVLPRAWVDDILPMTLTPSPKALVRTFVGRVEILSASEEQALLGQITKAFTAGTSPWEFDVNGLGRFGEPKLWRMRALTTDAGLRTYIEQLIAMVPRN